MANTVETGSAESRLGDFLKDRRQRMDAVALGFGGRRRTPGLRREEVAQRANISTTWYTWLEQGRGGAPSPRVLESLASALILTEAEREHLFLVGLGHPPKAQLPPHEGISVRLQRLLDAMTLIPATVATSAWDVVGWNRAARLTLSDYAAMAPHERNVLRRMFLDPAAREAQDDWEAVARSLVASFRAETARSGDRKRAADLVDELSWASDDFRRLWSANDVRTTGEGTKLIHHASVGKIALEFSSFAVDGRPDLKLIVYNPLCSADREKVSTLCAQDLSERDQTCATASSG